MMAEDLSCMPARAPRGLNELEGVAAATTAELVIVPAEFLRELIAYVRRLEADAADDAHGYRG